MNRSAVDLEPIGRSKNDAPSARTRVTVGLGDPWWGWCPPSEELTPELDKAYRDTLTASLSEGYRAMAGGGDAVDAVVEAIEVMEDSSLFNAGRGSNFTIGRCGIHGCVHHGRGTHWKRGPWQGWVTSGIPSGWPGTSWRIAPTSCCQGRGRRTSPARWVWSRGPGVLLHPATLGRPPGRQGSGGPGRRPGRTRWTWTTLWPWPPGPSRRRNMPNGR